MRDHYIFLNFFFINKLSFSDIFFSFFRKTIIMQTVCFQFMVIQIAQLLMKTRHSCPKLVTVSLAGDDLKQTL